MEKFFKDNDYNPTTQQLLSYLSLSIIEDFSEDATVEDLLKVLKYYEAENIKYDIFDIFRIILDVETPWLLNSDSDSDSDKNLVINKNLIKILQYVNETKPDFFQKFQNIVKFYHVMIYFNWDFTETLQYLFSFDIVNINHHIFYEIYVYKEEASSLNLLLNKSSVEDLDKFLWNILWLISFKTPNRVKQGQYLSKVYDYEDKIKYLLNLGADPLTIIEGRSIVKIIENNDPDLSQFLIDNRRMKTKAVEI